MSDAVIVTATENRQVVETDAGTQVVEQVLTTGGGTVDQSARDAAAVAQATADTKQDSATAATDAELTAHAADTTAVHGIADTSALATSADLATKQPLDSDLTAIAALSTTSYGRSLLALADAAAGRTSLGLGAAALLGNPSYSSVVLADSPSLYWPLDDTYGATDQSGNSRNGTASGGITIGGYSGSPISGGSKSTDFDGTDDKITSSYAGCFANGSPTTFEGWAYRDVRSAYHQLFGDVGTNSAGLRVDQNSQQVTFNSTGTITWAGAWPRNEDWVHWVLVADEASDGAELFLNGVSKGAVYAAWSWPSSGGFQVGNRQDNACPWNGKMAAVAIYPTALSQRRIMAHYLAGIGALIG